MTLTSGAGDLHKQGADLAVVRVLGVQHVRDVATWHRVARHHAGPHLGVDVNVILTPPCIFCMDNN
jgi:hypothetical protein